MEIAVGSELGQWQSRSRDACCSEALASDVALLAVADGFGTLGRNHVADVAVSLLRDYLRRKVRFGAVGARNASPLALRRLMLAAFAHANSRLFAQSGSHDDYVASGASLTAALVVGSQVYVGHVGQSRAYLVRDDRIQALTEDDAIAAEVSGGGKTTIGAGARVHSLLTRTLGTQSSLEATVTHFDLGETDRLVLCTDGIHKNLSAEELEFAASTPGSAADVVDRLLSLLKMRCGPNQDGGTVIVGRELTIPVALGGEVASARRHVSGAIGVTMLMVALIVLAVLLYEAVFPAHIALR
ncbi:MAG: protein serine/threonine phosphatase 2C family protein [Candidatus Eremiobacteraeota bacterium]|nr:protein serine/threonine phosphatase 2C family protein [Candidatus Eremiobacteraeota bacterium]